MGNLGTTCVLFGIAMVTVLGIYAITTSPAATSFTVTNYDSMPYLVGHITVEVADSDGNIKAYQQTDNFVTDNGLKCALDVLFEITAGECAAGTDEDKVCTCIKYTFAHFVNREGIATEGMEW